MAINNVINTAEEKNFTFLSNQSSILHTTDTNNITVNGVNVIVDKPKRGDIMCVRKDNGQVVWIDGLSINPAQLSSEFDTVGICLNVDGNKAMVRYKKEKECRWAAADRWEITYTRTDLYGNFSTYWEIAQESCDTKYFSFSNSVNTCTYDFCTEFNNIFVNTTYNLYCDILEHDSEKEFVWRGGQSDPELDDQTRNRLVITKPFRYSDNAWYTLFLGLSSDDTNYPVPLNRSLCPNINYANTFYLNNGFGVSGVGCCKYRYYNLINGNIEGVSVLPPQPDNIMSYVHKFSNSGKEYTIPVNTTYFNSPDTTCKILRDNFATYDEYFDSMMVKYPCGKGGAIAQFPSGKENTYKLAPCKISYKITSGDNILYPAANYAASINVNAPGLVKGNWWLPSVSEMVQIMKDLNPDDIIYKVLDKLSVYNSTEWSKLEISSSKWTSTKSGSEDAYVYDGYFGNLVHYPLYGKYYAMAITIYEF